MLLHAWDAEGGDLQSCCGRAVRDKSGRHSVIINAVRKWLGFFNVTGVVFPAYCIHFPFIVV